MTSPSGRSGKTHIPLQKAAKILRPSRLRQLSKELLAGKSYYDHKTICKELLQDIVLRVNANGLVVCRNWKKCNVQGKPGCAESYFRRRLHELDRTKVASRGREWEESGIRQ